MHVFKAGKGINKNKLNDNFEELKEKANANETNLNRLASTALQKDGSNLSQDIINKFQQEIPIILSGSGNIDLTDNKTHFLTLTGNGTPVLPTIGIDEISHTITLIVDGSNFSLDLSAHYAILNKMDIDTSEMYSILFMYHKVKKSWFYYISQ